MLQQFFSTPHHLLNAWGCHLLANRRRRCCSERLGPLVEFEKECSLYAVLNSHAGATTMPTTDMPTNRAKALVFLCYAFHSCASAFSILILLGETESIGA